MVQRVQRMAQVIDLPLRQSQAEQKSVRLRVTAAQLPVAQRTRKVVGISVEDDVHGWKAGRLGLLDHSVLARLDEVGLPLGHLSNGQISSRYL